MGVLSIYASSALALGSDVMSLTKWYLGWNGCCKGGCKVKAKQLWRREDLPFSSLGALGMGIRCNDCPVTNSRLQPHMYEGCINEDT